MQLDDVVRCELTRPMQSDKTKSGAERTMLQDGKMLTFAWLGGDGTHTG
jgi:hypothetical protein